MIYLEDLYEGLTFELGTTEVSKESIINFAEKYDPQKFHLDEAVAKKMFGGLIASGMQTASLANLLLVKGFLGKAACLASPGVDELRFVKPVYGGDQLTGKLTIASSKISASKPDKGLARLNIELFNGRNELVLSMIGIVFIGCRPN